MNRYWWSSTKKVIAVGRNYVKHVQELNNEMPSAPWWFIKPSTSINPPELGTELFHNSKDTHHEVELGIVIGKNAKNVKKSNWQDYVSGYCLGLDMTDRKGQENVKANGLPWEQCKGWDTSCILSDFIEKDKISDPQNVELWLSVNDVERQRFITNLMIFDIPTLFESITKVHTLEVGDVILTGTPHGVGACVPGDVIKAGITDYIDIECEVLPSSFN